MSLIQEALSRKDDENGRPKLTPPPRVIPPAYDVPPVLKLPEKPVSGGRRWTAVIVTLAVVLVLILGALGWLMYSTRQIVQTTALGTLSSQPKEEAMPPPAVQQPRAVSVDREPSRVQPERPAPSVEIRAVRPETDREPGLGSAPAPVETARPVRREESTAVAPVRPVAPPSAVPAERRPPVVTEIPRKSLEGVRTEPAAVTGTTSVWPRLSLHGVMAQAGPGQGSAIINGTVVEVGERIDGARLVEVQRNGILLEYRGNTQFVRVGQSTF